MIVHVASTEIFCFYLEMQAWNVGQREPARATSPERLVRGSAGPLAHVHCFNLYYRADVVGAAPSIHDVFTCITSVASTASFALYSPPCSYRALRMFHYTRVEHIESKARPGSASDAGLDEEHHSDPEEPASSSSPSKSTTSDMITSRTALASIFPLHVVCGA